MDHKTFSDLIGLIYDTSSDITHWPRLAKMLVEELAPSLSDTREPEERDRPLRWL